MIDSFWACASSHFGFLLRGILYYILIWTVLFTVKLFILQVFDKSFCYTNASRVLYNTEQWGFFTLKGLKLMSFLVAD